MFCHYLSAGEPFFCWIALSTLYTTEPSTLFQSGVERCAARIGILPNTTMTKPGVRYKHYAKDQATKSPTLRPGYISKHFTME